MLDSKNKIITKIITLVFTIFRTLYRYKNTAMEIGYHLQTDERVCWQIDKCGQKMREINGRLTPSIKITVTQRAVYQYFLSTPGLRKIMK